ncbi:hypothetical protein Tco_0077437 [Tanacetum coccineum]
MCQILETNRSLSRSPSLSTFRKHECQYRYKTYNESEDPEDHLKIFQAAAKTERWAMPEVWICQISQENSQKRTRERMSDQEAKEIKAEARETMPQPSSVNCS